ncbi:MAG: ribosome-associated translation inhibitor RaiA [Eubacteriales bacterium]|nr:ribosome-associated translation inhibitor RaiA [Eubacteriales bacterium]
MKFNIKGLNVNVSEKMRQRIEKKLGKLEKLFDEDVTVNVTLSTQKDLRTIEVTVPIRGGLLRAEESTDDFYTTLDTVQALIERQLRRHKTKLMDRTKCSETFESMFGIDDDDIYDEEVIKIEKVKKFDFKPMDPEEACLQMDLLGHSFFVFKDAETNETCVVYKRKNGTYGLITPED